MSCLESKTYCKDLGCSQKREDRPYCRFELNPNSRRSYIGSTTQKRVTRKKNLGGLTIEHRFVNFPIEAQIRHRQDKLDTRIRLREQEHCLEKGTVKYSAEDVAKTVGFPVRTLYVRKNPIPVPLSDSTRHYYVRTRSV